MKINLNNKIALITGSTQGIGLGCAQILGQAGAIVIINSRNQADGDATVKKLAEANIQAHFIQGDLGKEESIEKFFQAIETQFGHLDILVNNAGFNLFKGIQDTSASDFDAIMNVDLRGLFLATKAAVPLLKKAGGGSVINIASVHADLTIGNITAYAAAKGGVVAMTRSLCQELGPLGIRVNTVSPGFTQTPLLDRWLESVSDPEATMKQVNGYHPIGRIATPEDIGNVVTFLASEQGSAISGINLVVDGGHTTRLMH
jgi:NAD(P)-dependent dehydrogenase (short-subunit alcohol dehydrogenase family)